MQVTVRLAEPFWRAVGQRDLALDLESDARVSDLLAVLRNRYPALGRELAETRASIFVGEAEVGLEVVLNPGDHVHLVWPVAGG